MLMLVPVADAYTHPHPRAQAGSSDALSPAMRKPVFWRQRNGREQHKVMNIGFGVSISSLIVSIPNSAIPDSAIHAIDGFHVVEAAEDKAPIATEVGSRMAREIEKGRLTPAFASLIP